MKRNFYEAYRNWGEQRGGRVQIIRKDSDRNVSHSHDCYLCNKGTRPKRMFEVKPRRRKEKDQLRRLLRDEN